MRTSTTTLRHRGRTAAVAVAGAALLALVAACSSGTAGSADAAATPGAAASGDITWWGWTPDATNAKKVKTTTTASADSVPWIGCQR